VASGQQVKEAVEIVYSRRNRVAGHRKPETPAGLLSVVVVESSDNA
jgi:hypothetical protein